ncbi:hypothetical protein LJC04_06025 [Ruminococcaceae bacterium OttesenSCG-928-O06]|nr:hypothetical protein [Ruminococcaceae bacterium OttesenSCG-928-O06]
MKKEQKTTVLDILSALTGLSQEYTSSADFDEAGVRQELVRLLAGRTTLADIGISDEELQKIHERSKLQFYMFCNEWADMQPFRMLHRQYPDDAWMTQLWVYALLYACECIHHYAAAAQAELADEIAALLRDYGDLPKVQNAQLDMIYALFGSRVSAPAVLRGLRLLGGLLREEAPPTDLWQRLNREIEDIVVRHGEAPKVWPRQYGYWYFALTAIEAIV